MKNLFILCLGLVLTACGGGGGSGGTPSPALSADQSIFESLILAPGASYSPNWRLPSSGAPVQGTHYLYATPLSLTASPLGHGTQTPISGNTVNISTTPLAIPPDTVDRFLVKGVIVTDSKAIDRYSYSGSGVKREMVASDGVTLLASELRSGFQSVPLFGLVVAAAPAPDLWHNFNALFTNTSLLKDTVMWNPGARYIAYTATNLADKYRVFDNTTTTTGTTPSPVATGTTIAALMAAGGISSSSDNVTYTLAKGTVSLVNGVNTYVANNKRPNNTTDSYRTYYELNGNVYTGDLTRAATVIGGNAYSETVAGVSTVNYSFKLQLRVNREAIESLKAAVTF